MLRRYIYNSILIFGIVVCVYGANPFDQTTHQLFVNPWFQQEVLASSALNDAQKQIIANQPAAFWVDTFSAIEQRTPSLKSYLQAAADKQAQSGKKQTVFFIHYNLPNRDCAAAASNGEICCSGNAPNAQTGECDSSSYNSGDCTKGLNLYHQYTDKIVSILAAFPQLEIVALVEPDSLPNLATNLGVIPHCSQTTASAYIAGVTYALQQLAKIPNINIYIDAAHGGWLGWCGSHPCSSANECNGDKCVRGYCECPISQNQNAQKFVSVIVQILQSVGTSVSDKVRGFATNTANYQPLGYPFDDDVCQLSSQYNFAWNELRFIDFLDALFKKNGISKYWITDTGRNGYQNARTGSQQCQNWCNIKGGIGIRPTSSVAAVQAKLASGKLDALVWSKTPGESDGCSPGNGQVCTRVDTMCQRDCNSGFQLCPAPEAGQWHEDQIKFLVQNANPAIGSNESEI